ncbi:MAG: hypothetical protein WAW17_03080, partial [Rhodococcus sp. (in: high G+C Gram-positive bacteria)]|uniref:hypothetical protein n=1 Tax=Rhodococcus sp. TaxID=1831 RepID=UPI003BAFE942
MVAGFGTGAPSEMGGTETGGAGTEAGAGTPTTLETESDVGVGLALVAGSRAGAVLLSRLLAATAST